MLLERGASPDLQNSFGVTALMFAATMGRASTVRRLLQAGAQLGLQDGMGYTALWLAQDTGHTECVRAIKEHEAAATVAALGSSGTHCG